MGFLMFEQQSFQASIATFDQVFNLIALGWTEYHISCSLLRLLFAHVTDVNACEHLFSE